MRDSLLTCTRSSKPPDSSGLIQPHMVSLTKSFASLIFVVTEFMKALALLTIALTFALIFVACEIEANVLLRITLKLATDRSTALHA